MIRSKFHSEFKKITLAISLAALFSGCATQTAEVDARLTATSKAPPRKIAILAPQNSDSPEDTALLKQFFKLACTEQGFKVVPEDEAEAVILPVIVVLKPGQELPIDAPAFPPFRSSIMDTPLGSSGMMNYSDSTNFGASMLAPAPAPESRLGLMVTAIDHKTWSSIPPGQPDIPRLWRVTATTRAATGKESSLVPLLISGAAPYFGKDTNGKIVVKLGSSSL